MTAPVIPIMFGGLIAWSIYRRVRRNIGRQKLRPRRIIIIIALSILFVGRMLYRFWILNDAVHAPSQPQLFQSALTFLVFGLIAGYYIVYYIGLFVHTHDKKIPANPI
jgi:flagellar basal body-associated protein FliL